MAKSKGFRLGWKPIKEAKKVKITKDMIKGRKVPTDKIKKANKENLLIP